MNLVIVSGPPSSGKTSIILKTIDALKQRDVAVGVVKFDCLYTDDDILYEKAGVPVRKGLSGALCPDHFFASNIEERWYSISSRKRSIASKVNSVNPKATTMHINGLTGQGAYELSTLLYDEESNVETVVGMELRFPMPAAMCSYCLGETRIGEAFQMGNVRKMDLGEADE